MGKMTWRRRTAGLCVTMAMVTLGAGSAHASGLPVRGFIVQLRDAPANHRPQTTTQSAQAAQLRQQGQWRQRWQQLAQGTGLDRDAGWRLQAVGASAQRLAWNHTLTVQEQRLWQARLAARPEVAWVVPDTLEPALQSVTPDDPGFAGETGQWWLQPVSGSDSLPLAARLRGVPGIQTAWSRTTGDAGPVLAVLDTGITAHPDLAASRWLPGFDMVADWDSSAGRGYANDGDGRDADPTDPGDWVSRSDQTLDAGRYGDCSVQSSSWHGTTVAGIIAATSGNGLGVAGANWGVRVLPVRVAGKCGASVSDIVDGMRWAAGLAVCQRWTDSQDPNGSCTQWAPTNPTPARVVNISFGGAAACNAAYQSAVDELWAKGILVVAAGGNDHGDPSRPANCTHVLGVAALNRDGFKANYSNFGAALGLATVGGDDTGGRWGSLLADGGLLSLGNDGGTAAGAGIYNRHVGTSFAAPVVSAVAAQMLTLAPTLTATDLVKGLQASARPHVQSALMAACSSSNPGRCLCTTATCGAGILDADEALRWAQAAAAGLSYQAPSWPQVLIDNAELRQAVALGPDREAAAGTGTTTDGTASAGGGGGLGLAELAGLGLLLAAVSRLRAPRRRAASLASRRPRQH